MRSHHVLITEAELLSSSPERVYAWLESRATRDASIDDELEQALLGRHDPLIEIALARFSNCERTNRTLFSRVQTANTSNAHGRALRLAILSGESTQSAFRIYGVPLSLFERSGDGIWKWLAQADDGEIVALFTNRKIDQLFLCDFLEGKEPWQVLDDERRISAVWSLANNKRMTQEYSGDIDGYAEYSYESVFHAAWKLTETLPTTYNWANALGSLLRTVPRLPSHMDSPLAVAERWRPAQSDEIETAKSSQIEGYGLVRRALAQLALSKDFDLCGELLTSDDSAFRDAVYAAFPMTPDQVLAAYEIDKNLAVHSCLWNDHLWRSRDLRKALYDISWKDCKFNSHDMLSVNAFNHCEARRRKETPDWFKDQDDLPAPPDVSAAKAMEQSWKEVDAENETLFERQIERAKLRSGADYDFFDAGHRARLQMRSNDLLPHRTQDGKFRYTVAQGLIAACHTREDVVALTYVQRSQLLRLSRIEKLTWVCLIILIYLAYLGISGRT